jgi:hypothetical protein
MDANGEYSSIYFPNTTGYGWQMSQIESSRASFAGVAPDTTFVMGSNLGPGGNVAGNNFNPLYWWTLEQNYDAGAWAAVNDTFIEHYTTVGNGHSTGTVTNSAGFANDEPILIEEAADGNVIAVGTIDNLGAGANAAIGIDWIYTPAPDANPPVTGDAIESSSTSTITVDAGTFIPNRAIYVCLVGVGGTSASCASDGSNSTALIAPVGPTIDVPLEFLRTRGPGTAIILGSYLRQADSTARGVFGAVTVASGANDTLTISSSEVETWRTYTQTPSPHKNRVTYGWASTKATYIGPQPNTLRLASNPASEALDFIGMGSEFSYDPGATVLGMIGSHNYPRNFGIWGSWKFFNSADPDYGSRVEVGAPTTITGARTQTLVDANGTIPPLDLTGCLTDDQILSSGTNGAVKCGGPGVSFVDVGDDPLDPANARVAAIASFNNVSGSEISTYGLLHKLGYHDGDSTLEGNGIRFYEGPPASGYGKGTNFILVQSPATSAADFTQTLTLATGTIPASTNTTTTANRPLLSTTTAGAVTFNTTAGNTWNAGVLAASTSVTAPTGSFTTATVIANGASPPATCTVGSIFLDTDETNDTVFATTNDNVLLVCGTTNTWGLQGAL